MVLNHLIASNAPLNDVLDKAREIGLAERARLLRTAHEVLNQLQSKPLTDAYPLAKVTESATDHAVARAEAHPRQLCRRHQR